VIAFFVPGIPRGKGRPRHTKSGHTYTPAATREYEAEIRWHAEQAMQGRPLLQGTLRLAVSARFPFPLSATRARRAKMDQPKGTKPDLDNVIKAVLDGLNGVVFKDDAQVCRISADKWLSVDAEGVFVEVQEEPNPWLA
jgi:Holliday junction resolvase RusA-like endonuclease